MNSSHPGIKNSTLTESVHPGEDNIVDRKGHHRGPLPSSASLGITLHEAHGMVNWGFKLKKLSDLWVCKYGTYPYPGNIRRVIITGTIGPLENYKISWILFLEYDSEIDQNQEIWTGDERLTNLSLGYISTKNPLWFWWFILLFTFQFLKYYLVLPNSLMKAGQNSSLFCDIPVKIKFISTRPTHLPLLPYSWSYHPLNHKFKPLKT